MRGGLDEIVVEARFHGGHGDLLSAGAREHHDGAFRESALDPLQDLDAVGPAQLEVRDDEVDRAPLQRAPQVELRPDLFDLQVGKVTRQLATDEDAIIRIVVDQKHAHC